MSRPRMRRDLPTPTPEHLKTWAEWFDAPKNECVVVDMRPYAGDRWTAGFLLRRIAEAMEANPEHTEETT